jgi:hypothetical protein
MEVRYLVPAQRQGALQLLRLLLTSFLFSGLVFRLTNLPVDQVPEEFRPSQVTNLAAGARKHVHVERASQLTTGHKALLLALGARRTLGARHWVVVQLNSKVHMNRVRPHPKPTEGQISAADGARDVTRVERTGSTAAWARHFAKSSQYTLAGSLAAARRALKSAGR